MASKSRLGKGLGALFPDLPGDEAVVPRKPVTPVMPVAPAAAPAVPAGKAVEPKAKAEVVASSQTPRVSVPPMASAVAGASSQPADGAEESAPASRSTKRSGKSKRATMPALDASIAHPSDMFFNDTVSTDQRTAKGDVSRETRGGVIAGASGVSAVAGAVAAKDGKSAKSGKDGEAEEPQLKPVEGGYLAELKLTDIGPNLHQPRTVFDEDDLNELAASIKEVGILQPIVVRKRPASQIEAARRRQAEQAERAKSGTSDETEAKPSSRSDERLDSEYELIMGERRWRASQLAGLETIPAIVKTTSDDDMLRDALLENLHRVALNPLEEAAAYQQMIDDFGLTQAQLSKSVSKSRPQIANTLRLLNLPGSVQKKVAAGILTAGHARALLGLNDADAMDKLANRIIAEGLSVRSTEEIVAMANLENKEPKKPKANKNNPWAGSPIQTNLENHFDTKVSIKGTPKHGRIEIVFSSPEDMDRILELLMPGKDGSSSDSSEGKWV